MRYNIFFECSAVAYLILLNIYIHTQFSSESLKNRRFGTLAHTMLISTCLDVATGVTISYGNVVPPMVNTIFNSVYMFVNVMLGQCFIWYCADISEKNEKAKNIPAIERGINIAALVLLVINLFTGAVFSFSPEGEYIHGPLYILAFGVPMVFMAVSSFLLISQFRNFNRSQKMSVSIYIAILFIGCGVQFARPHVLFIHFATSLGLMLLLFSLETPDYRSLQQTLAELHKAKSEAEEAMIAAQSANHAKSDFLAGVSHEIRTPLNAILGYNELILGETVKESIVGYSERIEDAGSTLLAMISSLIDYGDIERGNTVIESRVYNTRELLEDIVGYSKYYAERKDLECRFNFDGSLPAMLRGDDTKLRQIMNSILSNAAKYTEMGFISVDINWSASDEKTGVMSVCVTDSGIGIKEEDISKITAAFERIDSNNSHSVEGMGIGLSIVTRLLSRMNGKFGIQSSYGSGTSVSFEVSQEIEDFSPIGAFETERTVILTDMSFSDATFPNAKLLVVDDNVINLDVICRNLKSLKASADTAKSGEKALELIKKNHYDMIFLDHMMPEMDGVETVKIIREQNLCPDTPVIVVTANAAAGGRSYYMGAGFDDYITKPVAKLRLVEVMEKFLGDMLVIEEEAPDASAKKSGVEEKFPFLDTSSGMAYCCEDEEFYISMIEEYVKTSRYNRMTDLFAKENYEDYRIQAHALKSASRTIGANAMAAIAEKLELAQKSGNIGYILENHDEAMREYKLILEKISAALEG